jgi:hypothetical protein
MEAAVILSVVLLALGVLLLLHHGWKHAQEGPESLAQRESCIACCFFQPSDISNHETWILLCFTNALTILVMHAVYTQSSAL